MMERTTKRVALISGASRGIGDHIAATLLGEGWSVSLGMRSPSLPQWAVGHEGQVHLAHYDANDASAEKRWSMMRISISVVSMLSWPMPAS